MRSADRLNDHDPGLPVAVCHQDPLLRLGILAALRDVPAMQVHAIDTRDDALPALARWRARACDGCVAVCDYETGAALAQAQRRHAGPLPVMVVTQRDREDDVQNALARGVQGYLLVGARLEEMVQGVFALSQGQRFLSASAAQRMADRIGYEALTPREDEVLRLVAVGWSNKRVAARLGVTEGTVKTHVRAILGTLAVGSRTEAAAVAMRRGLLPPELRAGPRATGLPTRAMPASALPQLQGC